MEDPASRDKTQSIDFGDEQYDHSPITDNNNNLDVEAQRQHNSSSSRKAAHSLQRLVTPHDSRHDDPSPPTHHKHIDRTETNMSKLTAAKSMRRRARGLTETVYGAEEMGRTTGWAPGLEPGIDTSDPPPYNVHDDTEHHDVRHLEQLHQQCEITVVDYSQEHMSTRYLDNDGLQDFLEEPQEDWSQVRWINCNGLSWDVIKSIGNKKRFHRLAIEDLMNTRNRTKADWYHDHTYVVLPLQKLVHIGDEHDDSSGDEGDDAPHLDRDVYGSKDDSMSVPSVESQTDHERKRQERAMKQMRSRKGAIRSLIQDLLTPKKPNKAHPGRREKLTKSGSFKHMSKVTAPYVPKSFQTHSLQQYHAGPNKDRIEYMQRRSALGHKGLGVSVEQVSIFLTSDNTVVSFFEYSSQDVEIPIMRRLQSKSTILRQSCDASMLLQSILDTIIDLAIPVTAAYQDAIGDVELNVLTDPNIEESTSLYILTSEVATLRSAIAPVAQLIVSLRGHKSTASALTLPARPTTPSLVAGISPYKQLQNERPALPTFPQTQRSQIVTSGVTISELTKTYLGDVEDHALLIQDAYDQMRRNADNLVDLIFNTVSAYQNESMKQLTIVTCFFLPLTFMTGYFGMNFELFPGVQQHSDKFFWTLAIPICAVVALILLREWLERWVVRWANKTLIKRGRQRRLEKGRR